ncbi:MAG: hypothetical protein UW71_C0004G0001, partial [Parcubacteria group bacterium GW2011_GWB1_44_7]
EDYQLINNKIYEKRIRYKRGKNYG